MKTTDIAKRLKPLVDRFCGELAAFVQARVDAAVAEAEQAIESAISAIVADLEPGDEASAAKPASPVRVRNWSPTNYPPSRRGREERAAPQANGKKPVTCSKCGFVGGNARGCGTAHETIVADDPGEVDAPVVQREVKPAKSRPIEADEDDDEDDEVVQRDAKPPAPLSKRDRFAQIEASAAARRSLGSHG